MELLWKPIADYDSTEHHIVRWHRVHQCLITVFPNDFSVIADKRLDWIESTHTTAWPEECFSPFYINIEDFEKPGNSEYIKPKIETINNN